MHFTERYSLGEFSQGEIDLLKSYTAINYFLSWGWFKNVLETTMSPDEKPLFLFFYKDINSQMPCVCLPLKIINKGMAEGRLLSLTTPYSCSFDLLYNPKIEVLRQEVADSFLKWLSQSKREISDIYLDMFEDLEFAHCISQAVESYKYTCEFYKASVNLYDDIYDEGGVKLSQRVLTKNLYLRKSKKLKKDLGYNILTFDQSSTDTDFNGDKNILSQLERDYKEVEKHSWKEPESFENHISGFIKESSEDGVLLISVLYAAQKPIGAQLWLKKKSGMAVEYTNLKTFYDQNYKKYSPGMILYYEIIEYIEGIEAAKKIDLGRGDYEYKKQWMKSSKLFYGIALYNQKTIRGMMLSLKLKFKNIFLFFLRKSSVNMA